VKDKKKRLKIAYFIPRFLPFKGGAEQNIYAMATRMSNLGEDVFVVTTNVKFRDETLPKEEKIDGINIIRLKALIQSLYLGFYPELFVYLIKNKFDIIHTSGIGFIWREFCLIFAKLFFQRKAKYICTPHGPFMALGEKKGFRGFAKKTYTFVLSIIVPKLYDKIIAVNELQYIWMTKEYKIPSEKIVVVPNGIDQNYLEEEIFPHKKEERIVITYLNRHEWYKGIQFVISALHNIKLLKQKKNLPDFVFYIMGRPGNFTKTLQEQVKKLEMEEECKFIYSPSDIERDRIFFEESQINILPSKWEATGITLIEAMAKGNVIITTKQNEAYDLVIQKGKSGYAFDFGDVGQLTKILLKLFSDFDHLQSIRNYNVKFAKNFTWEAVFPKYKKMIYDLAYNTE